MSRAASRSTKNQSGSCSAAVQMDFGDDAASEDSGVPNAGYVNIGSHMVPRIVTHVASRLVDEQKELFADMSFGAMLSLPQILHVDRQFSLWVYSRTDPDQPAVKVGDGSFRPVDLGMVGRVTGLGSGQFEIKFPHEASCADRKIYEDVCELLDIDPKQKFITLADLENILLNPMVPMEEQEKGRQCAAFALLCGACLFNPICSNKKGDSIPPELFLAVRDPSVIHQINWNKYILDVIVHCVRKLLADMESGETVVHLNGFQLVPQIIYMDAMSRGNGVVPGNPRLPLYSQTQMKAMVAEDTDRRARSGKMKIYGKCKVRPYRAPVPVLESVLGAQGAHGIDQTGLNTVGSVIGNPVCVSSDEVPGPENNIYVLSDLPEWQSQVLEFISADVHDHMSHVNDENLNLKSQFESAVCSIMGMIDARNESNVTTVNTMLSRILERIGKLRVQIVGGALRFIDLGPDNGVDESGQAEQTVVTSQAAEADTVGDGGMDNPVIPAEAGRRPVVVHFSRLKDRLRSYVAPGGVTGTDGGGTSGASHQVASDIGRVTQTNGGGTSQQVAPNPDMGGVNECHVSGTSQEVPAAVVNTSPQSLDLNRRSLLREETVIGSSVTRRLEMNTPSRVQTGFVLKSVGGHGAISQRNEQMGFVTAFVNGSNAQFSGVQCNPLQQVLNGSATGSMQPAGANCGIVGTSALRPVPLSSPIPNQFSSPIPLSQTASFLYAGNMDGSLQRVQYMNVPGSGISAVDTSLGIGSKTQLPTDYVHNKRGYAQSSLLGWAKPTPTFKRSRVPEYSLANSVDLMTPEALSASKDLDYFNLLMSATYNELVRTWYKHVGPMPLEIAGDEITAQWRLSGFLQKSALTAILRLQLYPLASGKIVLGPSWAERCRMQFTLAYSNFFFECPEVKYMFDKKCDEAPSVTAMSIIYVKEGWCLYVFDVATATLHVVDPLIRACDVHLMRLKHAGYMEDTQRGFIKCAQAFWGPASVPAYERWSPVFHPCFVGERTDSGVQCLHHIMTFIPSQRPQNLPYEVAVRLKHKFLRAIMSSTENVGDLPVRLQMR